MSKVHAEVILSEELCKGCGRCIEACPKHAIHPGTEINQSSGLIPISIDADLCNHCGLCVTACPEPYGLVREEYELDHPKDLYGPRPKAPRPASVPDQRIELPELEPMVLKGNHAAAIGAILAGCRHVFGYPITPSTEGAELLAKLLPKLNGVFLQACSEVATVNHMYGCGAAGLSSLTFTSSPGFSLMLEGISYMIGSEVPGVFVNVMRPGPGLGYIGPEQSDIKLMCRGLGHGNTHAIVLAPSSPQEMLDLTFDAVELSFRYRNPVVVAADGYLGQITGRVNLPDHMVEPGLPDWAVWGDRAHRGNLISSIFQDWAELEAHNEHLCTKYEAIEAAEQRARGFRLEDAELIVLAANTPARMAKSAVEHLRADGLRVGLFQPVTLWPFPIDELMRVLERGRARRILVVEASYGQLEDELRLALHHAGITEVSISHLRHMGGVLPADPEIQSSARVILGGVS
ncbi:MAG: 4Fe-4S binding protein [Deltaproteobacteria bacterium]|nr:4Fe-4S binding protein [Deltaproteobacteria bacterium]